MRRLRTASASGGRSSAIAGRYHGRPTRKSALEPALNDLEQEHGKHGVVPFMFKNVAARGGGCADRRRVVPFMFKTDRFWLVAEAGGEVQNRPSEVVVPGLLEWAY